jgi:hypothetical protein
MSLRRNSGSDVCFQEGIMCTYHLGLWEACTTNRYLRSRGMYLTSKQAVLNMKSFIFSSSGFSYAKKCDIDAHRM